MTVALFSTRVPGRRPLSYHPFTGNPLTGQSHVRSTYNHIAHTSKAAGPESLSVIRIHHRYSLTRPAAFVVPKGKQPWTF